MNTINQNHDDNVMVTQLAVDSIVNEFVSSGGIIENGIIKNPGKFEGESVATLYFYECSMLGDGLLMRVDDSEREVLDIDSQYVYLHESNDGFVTLIHFDNEEDATEFENENADWSIYE